MFILVVISVYYDLNCNCYYTQLRSPGYGECARLQVADLGTFDRLSTNGLVAHSFGIGDAGVQPQLVRILSYQLVCEAFGLRRGTISSTSAIVTYECEGVRCTDSHAGSYVRRNRTDQFNFDCISRNGISSFFPPQTRVRRYLRTPAATKQLQISVNTRCGVCIHPSTAPTYSDADEDTHCICKCTRFKYLMSNNIRPLLMAYCCFTTHINVYYTLKYILYCNH